VSSDNSRPPLKTDHSLIANGPSFPLHVEPGSSSGNGSKEVMTKAG